MLYTPQQLAGGSKFSGGVRVGNWYEDDCYEKDKIKDFNAKRDSGSLLSSTFAAKQSVLRQRVPHSFSDYDTLKYNDTIMLRNAGSRAFVACNVFEELEWNSGRMQVLCENRESKEAEPVAAACNTLVITRDKEATASGISSGGPSLCYGDVFYLCSNPSLTVDKRTNMRRAPLFLSSSARSVSSGLEEGQFCCMAKSRSRDSRWQVMPLDMRRKVVYEGKPVPPNSPVLLLHKSSKQFLAVDSKNIVVKDFKARSTKKCLEYSTQNQFSFVTARDRRYAADNRTFTRMTPEALLTKIRLIVNQRGVHGIRGLALSFKIMDDAGDRMLDKEDFKYGLSDYGIGLSNDEFEMVMSKFDTNRDGFVSFDEFLGAIRGPMSRRRRDMVNQAYKLLDADGSGIVTLKDITSLYDVSKHPEFISGKKSKDEIMREFVKQWDSSADGTITMKEFHEYFRDVSASIDTDDYFELMMRNAWHISGGEGQMQNTTCRRVLVVHTDGSQTIEEIKNDLGIKATDMDKMIRKLKSQGVRDIRTVKLYG